MRKYEVRDATLKYGFENVGMFATQDFKKGEEVYRCNTQCSFSNSNFVDGRTRKDIDDLCKKYPDSANFITRYIYTIDDDLFCIEKNYKEKKVECECGFINHSCEPNCTFHPETHLCFIARRDIKAGEELTYDYQIYEAEFALNNGLKCKCGSKKCRGVLKFNDYRNIDWITANYKYCSPFVRKRIDELSTKWFSTNCHLKRYNDKYDLRLTALKSIEKDELVAVFSDINNINEKSHYLKHSTHPNSYLGCDGQVYAINHIGTDTEITLNYENK